MGTFSKIKKYSKSSSIIDEKIKTFNDELYKTLLREGPTNSTSGIYIVEPEKDTTVTVNPEPILDLSADSSDQYGTDTTGIFDEFGNSILIDPPGTWQIQDGPTSDPSASLGPMISYYDSASNTTYLGYVRQSDRSMINLGRITGQMSTWDGVSNFTSYGQLTLSQAQWYQAEHNGGRVGNYRVFYSGKSDNTDPYRRVFGKMINTPKGAGSNPWVVYTSNPIKSDQQITVKFYYDGGSLYSGARPPIFYDTNTGLPNGISAVDTVDFTVPAGDGVQLQQGQNGGGFDINGIGLKWRYLRGPENPYGHDEPDGDPNGVSTWYHPDDYFVWYMTINGKDYPLPPGLNGMAAAIGIPGGFGNWNKGSANSKDGSGKRTIPGKIPPKTGGFDPNILPGSAKDKKKDYKIGDFKSASDFSAFKAGGGNAAVASGKSVQDVIDQGKKNLGQYDSGPKSSDPYTLTSQEKNYLNQISKQQGPTAARDAQINIEIKKLQNLDKAGKLSPQLKIDLAALQANQIYNNLAKGANTASEYLGYLMLAKDVGQLAGKGIAKGVTSLVSKPSPGLSAATKSTIGSTGLDLKGFKAITGGEPYVPSSKPQILGKGAYSSPTVGKSGGPLGGTGGAKYAGSQGSLGGAKTPGGVVQSVVPGGAPKIPFIEPQAKVPAQTFDKGAEIARKLADPNYRSGSALANKLRQQATQVGYKPGQTNIPYAELPKINTASSLSKAGLTAGSIAALTQLQGSTPQSGPGSIQSKIQQAIDKPSIETLGADNYAAFKAGGGNAALNQQGKSPESLANIIIQGKQNISKYDSTKNQEGQSKLLSVSSALGAGAASGLLPGGIKISPSWNTQQAANAVGNVKDYTKIIQNSKVGLGKEYSFSDWTPSKEGLKANLLKDGKPVIGADGKPLYMTASGVDKDGSFTSHGKGQQTTGNNLKNIINQVKNTTPATETGKVSVTSTKTASPEKVKYTEFKSGSGPKPTSGTPSSFKSLSRSASKFLKFSYELEGQFISESTRSILKNIKKPYKLPEIPKEKYKFNFSHKVRSVGHDLMKQAEVPSSFKRAEERMWGRHEKYMNARMSQERKNQVLDFVGTSDHAWEWMMEKNQKNSKNVMYGNFDIKKYMGIESDKVKGNIIRIEQTDDNDALFYFQDENGNKSVMLQSDFDGILNETRLSESEMDEKEDDYTDNLYRKSLKKLGYKFDYSDKPSKKGYPNNPPPKMINGWHPEFGDRADYYNKLDPQSADFMPSTENPEIDIKVEKSKSKKFKVKEETKINWKKDISKHKKHYMEGKVVQEGMTSSGTFFTTLPSLGDTDLSAYNIIDPSSYTNLSQYGVTTKTIGSGSGLNGGFNVGDHIVFSGTDLNARNVEFKSIDTTNTDTIKLTGIVGNNSNGGISPATPLELIWYNNISGEFGSQNIIPIDGSSSLHDYIYTLPPGAIGNNVSFYLVDTPNNGEMYIGKTIPVSGINDFPLDSSYANLTQFYVSLNNVSDGPDPTGQTTTYHSIGFYYWVNIQNQKHPGYYGFGGAPNGDPAPVSGATKYVNLTNADLIYVGKAAYNHFKNSATYGITNFSFQRRTPQNVFVSLDSPEATSFIRSEPNLSNLSPQERLEKLREMLKSSDEYVQKMLGSNFPGTGAVPPGESGTTPGVQVTDIPTTKGIFTTQKSDAFMKGWNQGRAEQGLPPMDNMGRVIGQSTSSSTSSPTTKGIFTSPKSDSFMKGWNQGRAEQGLPPMDNMGRVISANNISTSTTNSHLQSRDQNTIDTLKKEIEVRTKLQTTGDAQKYYSSPSMQKALDKLKSDLASREKDFANKYGSGQNNQQPSPPQPSPPQLDKYGRQIGTPLPPGVKQDMEKGGKTASPVGDAAIMAAAALAKGGIKAAAPSIKTPPIKVGSQLPARGSAQWNRMAKEYTRANPGQYNPFMSNAQNQLMQKYGVGKNATPLRSLKNSYDPEGQLISERKKLKSPQEILDKIPGYYDGKPAPLGFPETPPPEMVNGMHPDLVDGKKTAQRFNRLDPESAKATPLTGNPHIDKKIKAARKQPK